MVYSRELGRLSSLIIMNNIAKNDIKQATTLILAVHTQLTTKITATTTKVISKEAGLLSLSPLSRRVYSGDIKAQLLILDSTFIHVFFYKKKFYKKMRLKSSKS